MGELGIQIQLNKNLKGSNKKTHFSKDEKEFILANCETMTASDIGKRLCRNKSSILRFCAKNGITFSENNPAKTNATDDEIKEFVRKNPTMSSTKVTQTLHVNGIRVRKIRKEMGLVCEMSKRKHVKIHLVYDWLLNNADHYKDKESLAEAFKTAFK